MISASTPLLLDTNILIHLGRLTTDKDFDVLHPESIQREWVDPQTLR